MLSVGLSVASLYAVLTMVHNDGVSLPHLSVIYSTCNVSYHMHCMTQGMLGVGAALLGSPAVVGIDIDPDALEVAQSNCQQFSDDLPVSSPVSSPLLHGMQYHPGESSRDDRHYTLQCAVPAMWSCGSLAGVHVLAAQSHATGASQSLICW